MRPLRIAVEGLRSFRSEVVVDFGDRTQIAIVGDTGAGKSSILEAMIYALYGQPSLGGRSKQELLNDTSDVMRVVLRFRVSGQEWEVARVDRKAGTGLRTAVAQLVRYGPGGETIEKVEHVRPVNDRVQRLIGLDSDAFLRTVILPQGRFARLLVEDAPSARTEILRQVWRTRELEEAGVAAGRKLAEVRMLSVRLADEVARHPEDPRAHLEGLEAVRKEAGERSGALAALRDRAWQALEALRGCEAVTRAAEGVLDRVDPAAMDRLAERLAPVAREQRRIDAERKEMEAAEAELRRRLKSIPSDDRAGLQELARVLAALEAMPGEAERAAEAAAAMRGAGGALAKAEREATEAGRALGKAAARLEAHRELAAPLSESVELAKEERTKVEKWHERCEELRVRLGRARDELTNRRRELDAVAPKLDAARGAEVEARGEAERAEAELADAQRANAAAAAAQGLCPGDDCPVCERELPAGWAPPPDQGLEEACTQQSAARARLREARGTVASVEADDLAARRSVSDIQKRLDGVGSELTEALGRLRRAAGPGAFPATMQSEVASGSVDHDPPLPDRTRILSTTTQLLRDAESRLAEHNSTTERLRAAHTTATVAARTAEVTRQGAAAEVRRTRKAATERLEALRGRIQSLPPPFRPNLALPPDPVDLEAIDTAPVDRARYAATERQEILALREEKRRKLRDEIEKTGTRLARLEDTRRAAVEQPLRLILEELNTQRAAVAEAIREEAIRADFDEHITLPPTLYRPDPGLADNAIGQLRRAMNRSRELAADLRQRATLAAASARAEARRIAAALDPPADPSDLGDLFVAVDARATDARYAARNAERDRDAFAAIFDDLLELHRTASDAADLERALGDLDAALKPGAFLKWLTLRRSRALLIAASQVLTEITGGRYAFADPGAMDDQQWLVVDTQSGQARTPASLSGGEQFIGSLSLALGMVEMMARSGGRLESLFLDEGFGSLDRGNLDAAIEALAKVARRGRMVGVISHVGAVAEQIDDVLAVTRTPAGSRAVWMSSAERKDAALAGASALAGLLD